MQLLSNNKFNTDTLSFFAYELLEIDVYQKTLIPTLRGCKRPATRVMNLLATTLCNFTSVKEEILEVLYFTL